MQSAFSPGGKPRRGRLACALAATAALAAVAGLSAPVFAQSAPGAGFSAGVGLGQGMQRYMLAWESQSFWGRQFDGSRLDLSAEAGAAHWHARRNEYSDKSSAWQLSLTPMLRWSFDKGLYLEAGIGPTLFSRTNLGGKEISTRFQIGNHIGGGYNFADGSRLGLRFSHYSNAGIKQPNPGLNVVQLLYTYAF